MNSGFVGEAISGFLGGTIDAIMHGIWAAAVGLLRGAFQLADAMTTTHFVTATGDSGDSGDIDPTAPIGTASPIATVWPVLRWLSLVIALGLFFVQLTSTMLRGGRGSLRLFTGPLAYAVATGMTAGGIGLLFAAGDGLAALLLQAGLRADGFVGVLDSPTAPAMFGPAPALEPGELIGPVDPERAARGAEAASQVDATARAVTLGLVALFGVLPAAIGFLLESVFRLVVFLVLVGSAPIAAAGLLADATHGSFWRMVRWAVAGAVMKPALALILVLGVNALSTPTGLAGLLAGVGLLLVALLAPFTIYRLLAFVDPGTNAGTATRSWLAGTRSGGSGGTGGGGGTSGGNATETAHASRFDGAARSSAASGAGSGGAPAAAGAGAGGAIAGVGAAVAAAGKFAGQYTGRTMDASGIGYPHGGSGGSGGRGGAGAPPAARGRLAPTGGAAGGVSGGDPVPPAGPVVEPNSYDHDPGHTDPGYTDPGYDDAGYGDGGSPPPMGPHDVDPWDVPPPDDGLPPDDGPPPSDGPPPEHDSDPRPADGSGRGDGTGAPPAGTR